MLTIRLSADGDRNYSRKSESYYKKLGLNATVRYVPERVQQRVVVSMIEEYNPDILIMTGHDAMLRKGMEKNNIYNYTNSLNFVRAVEEARKKRPTSEELVIFAGACQSYYEAIMMAGSDFASSPGRILIDYKDPLILAHIVATTNEDTFVYGYDVGKQMKEGDAAISGKTVRGKKRTPKISI